MTRLHLRRIACAWLLVATTGSAAPAGRFGDIGDLDLPRSMRVDNIGESLRINGVETRAWQFHSTDDADAIAAHFTREWRGRIARTRAGGWDIVSHRDDDWLITVQTGPADALGATRGFIAIARLFATRGRVGPDVARLPGTRLLQDIEAEDLGRRSRTLLLTSEQSAQQNLEFYRAHFRAEGFTPISTGALVKGRDGGALSLTRRGEQLDVAVAERGGRSWITIVQVYR